jgi:hypothetical protein
MDGTPQMRGTATWREMELANDVRINEIRLESFRGFKDSKGFGLSKVSES